MRVLRQSADFSLEENPEGWRTGRYGTFKKAPIYVSQAIPEGYFLEMGRLIPELTAPPEWLLQHSLPELDDSLRWELEAHLSPLMM